MIVKFKKAFLKDLNKLPEEIKKQVQQIVYIDIPNAIDLLTIRKIKKIKRYGNYYRLKLGNYRIGFEYKDRIATFYRVLHRKDIYKYFP